MVDGSDDGAESATRRQLMQGLQQLSEDDATGIPAVRQQQTLLSAAATAAPHRRQPGKQVTKQGVVLNKQYINR